MRPLDSKIQKAVQILWVDRAFAKGEEAKNLLEQSAESGNPDAYYFLARIYAGEGFVDSRFGFPEEDQKAEDYLSQSIAAGSALGMFAGMRFGGYKPKDGTFVHPPYHSMREIWDEVCAMADNGDLFVKYLVANAYYYGDVAKLTGIDFSHVSKQYLESQFREWALKAIPMYDELIDRGLTMCLGNYIDIITSGDYGVPKNEQKARELRRVGAEKGDPFYMVKAGQDCVDTQPDQAEWYFLQALDQGYADAGYYLAKLYTFNGKKPRDLRKAKMHLEECLEAGKQQVGCHNLLGEIYFHGGDGIEPDYNRAFQHLTAAAGEDNHWGSDMLGTCYLKGWGTAVDYKRAMEELNRYRGEELSAVGLGEIYAYGLGVPVNIKEGMAYWNKFPNNPAVIEHKKHFKKTLFGWKQI